MAELTHQFLERFVLPLVGGGRLRVGRPLDADDLKALQGGCEQWVEQKEQIEGQRRKQAALLWPWPIDVSLTRSDVRLLVGVHNLLFCSHPAYVEWTHAERRLSQFGRFTRGCLNVGAPGDELQMVARHTLLAKLPQLGRVDVDVHFWAGQRRFVGQDPPARLLCWPSIRRVQQERRKVQWLGELVDEQQRCMVRTLLEQSPLTELLALPRPFPSIRWERLVDLLRWPRVARLVCYDYLRRGIDRVGPAIAQSFWELVDRARASAQSGADGGAAQARVAVRMVVGLVEHLYATSALTANWTARPSGASGFGPLAGVLAAAWCCGLSPRGQGKPRSPLDLRVQAALAQLVQLARAEMGRRADELAADLQDALDVTAQAPSAPQT